MRLYHLILKTYKEIYTKLKKFIYKSKLNIENKFYLMNVEKIRKILAVTFLVWLVAAVVIVVSFDLYDRLFPFIILTIMFQSGIIALYMNEKFLK